MPRKKKEAAATSQKPIEQYEHLDKDRLNNPPVGLVDSHTDNGGPKKKIYAYDPHLDPQLQWAGKAEHTSFEVPTVSLHVHERIDPRRIIESVRRGTEIAGGVRRLNPACSRPRKSRFAKPSSFTSTRKTGLTD